MTWSIEKVSDKVQKNPSFLLLGGAGVIILIFLLRSQKTEQPQILAPAGIPDYTGGGGGYSGGDISSLFTNLSTMIADMEARRADEMAQMSYLQYEMMQEMQQSSQDLFIQLSAAQQSMIQDMQQSNQTLFAQLSAEQRQLIEDMETQAVMREQRQLALFFELGKTIEEILSSPKETIIYQSSAPISQPPVYQPSVSSGSSYAPLYTPMPVDTTPTPQGKSYEEKIYEANKTGQYKAGDIIGIDKGGVTIKTETGYKFIPKTSKNYSQYVQG